MRENWRNFKFRQKGLLGKHFPAPVATINVKIYQKNTRFFVHVDDLMYTDGHTRYDFVHDFSYAIVGKYVERTEDPGTYHLDIKVYLAFDFNPKRLPEISDFWGEYVREAIEIYLASPKASPK